MSCRTRKLQFLYEEVSHTNPPRRLKPLDGNLEKRDFNWKCNTYCRSFTSYANTRNKSLLSWTTPPLSQRILLQENKLMNASSSLPPVLVPYLVPFTVKRAHRQSIRHHTISRKIQLKAYCYKLFKSFQTVTTAHYPFFETASHILTIVWSTFLVHLEICFHSAGFCILKRAYQ